MRNALSLLLLAGLVSACAAGPTSETKEQTTWTPRTLYAPELCWTLYANPDKESAEYWHIRRWCDRRETRSDPFI